MTEPGFCPRIDKHTLILHNPSLCALIVLGTAGLFVLLISLSQRHVELPLPGSFQTAGLSYPYLCFRRLLWLLPLIFDLRVTQNLAKTVVLPSHGSLFFPMHRKYSNFYACYRLQFKVLPAQTAWPTYLMRSEIYTQTFVFGFLLNPTWEEKAQTKVFAVCSNFIFALEAGSQYIPQKMP